MSAAEGAGDQPVSSSEVDERVKQRFEVKAPEGGQPKICNDRGGVRRLLVLGARRIGPARTGWTKPR